MMAKYGFSIVLTLSIDDKKKTKVATAKTDFPDFFTFLIDSGPQSPPAAAKPNTC